MFVLPLHCAMSQPPSHTWSPLRGFTRPPCGLAPTEGIPMVAQAVLHRELLHVHASLAHIHTLLQQPLALRSPPLLDRVTHPHLRSQLQGLDHTLTLALRVNHTAIHYTHELLTALGLLHILHHSPEQLEDELQGRTAFADRPPLSTTSTITTVDGVVVFEGRTHFTFAPHISPPPITTSSSITRSGGRSTFRTRTQRSRSQPRLNPR